MTAWPAVAVVGGGIIGGACALELARRGYRVTLFERGAPGGEASNPITPFIPQRFAT